MKYIQEGCTSLQMLPCFPNSSRNNWSDYGQLMLRPLFMPRIGYIVRFGETEESYKAASEAREKSSLLDLLSTLKMIEHLYAK